VSLEAKNLWKQLDYKEVIRGVELTVSPGEVVGVFGEPGSGKSTLMRLLSGLLTPTAGEIRIFGDNINSRNSDEIYARMGIYLQKHEAYERMKAGDYLRFFHRLQGEKGSVDTLFGCYGELFAAKR